MSGRPVARPAPPVVPREVRWAGLALWTVGALSAISALLTVLSRGQQIEDLEAITSLTEAEIEQSVNLGITISAVFGLAVAGLAMISAVNLLKGKSWARVSGTIVAGLTSAFAVLRISGGGPTVGVSLVVLLSSVAAVVLLFRRSANTFLTAGQRR